MILILGTATVASAALIIIKGSGNVVKEERTVKDFKGIDVGNAIDVILTVGESKKVVVESDDNIIKYIKTEVTADGTLKIKMEGKIKIKSPTKLNVYVTCPEISKLRASGASSILGKNEISGDELKIESSGASDIECSINTKKLTIDISGASDIKLKGKTLHIQAETSGASSFIASAFQAETADVDVSGASDAKFKVTKELNADISGASSFKYSGSPQVKKVNRSGASSISTY